MTSATDNRTTELRNLLDERGIEYAESQDRFRTRFRFNYCEACGDYLNEIEVMGACITASKSYLTPDQAIAATLGSDASADRLAERLRSIADEMRNVGASSMKPHELLAFYAREVDKVADLLKFAAALGNGTGRNEWAEFGKFRCSECWTQVDAISTNTTQPMPIRYCPNCGAKAVG